MNDFERGGKSLTQLIGQTMDSLKKDGDRLDLQMSNLELESDQIGHRAKQPISISACNHQCESEHSHIVPEFGFPTHPISTLATIHFESRLSG